jgi:hypothetical protein
VSEQDELPPKEAARLKARERKSRPPKMVVDNAGVKRVQIALANRARTKKK